MNDMLDVNIEFVKGVLFVRLDGRINNDSIFSINKNLQEIKSVIQDEEKFKNVYIKENDFNSKDILIKENNNITNIETTIDNKNEKFVPAIKILMKLKNKK